MGARNSLITDPHQRDLPAGRPDGSLPTKLGRRRRRVPGTLNPGSDPPKPGPSGPTAGCEPPGALQSPTAAAPHLRTPLTGLRTAVTVLLPPQDIPNLPETLRTVTCVRPRARWLPARFARQPRLCPHRSAAQLSRCPPRAAPPQPGRKRRAGGWCPETEALASLPGTGPGAERKGAAGSREKEVGAKGER